MAADCVGTTAEFKSILCADWGKTVGKRTVYLGDVASRSVRRLSCSEGWSLQSLLSAATRQAIQGPVLVAIDAPFGVPASYLAAVRNLSGWSAVNSFVDLLKQASFEPRFFQPTNRPEHWRLDQPFFAVPGGTGGLMAYRQAARAQGSELLRSIDKRTRAKSLFITSGIPGSVGSATVALWRELGPLLEQQREFRLWPFEGELDTLCRSHAITVAETYPRAAYATALIEKEPRARPPLMLAKTDAEVRRSAIAALRDMGWLREHEVVIEDLDHAQNSEDDFDACITAAALLRCQLEGLPLCEAEFSSREIEGGILGTGSVDLSLRERCWVTVPRDPKTMDKAVAEPRSTAVLLKVARRSMLSIDGVGTVTSPRPRTTRDGTQVLRRRGGRRNFGRSFLSSSVNAEDVELSPTLLSICPFAFCSLRQTDKLGLFCGHTKLGRPYRLG